MSLKPWERGATILIEAVAVSRAIQECSNEIKRLQAENEMLKAWLKEAHEVDIEKTAALKELAKVKAENDELRALIIETKNEETEDAAWERINTIVFNEITAVADFKQMAIEACDSKLLTERCPQDEAYNNAIEECIISIESLPLMGEKK